MLFFLILTILLIPQGCWSEDKGKFVSVDEKGNYKDVEVKNIPIEVLHKAVIDSSVNNHQNQNTAVHLQCPICPVCTPPPSSSTSVPTTTTVARSTTTTTMAPQTPTTSGSTTSLPSSEPQADGFKLYQLVLVSLFSNSVFFTFCTLMGCCLRSKNKFKHSKHTKSVEPHSVLPI